MQLPDMDTLRCFEAAARHLSFRSAAAEVARSPSAFSDRISQLEGVLGEQLFERTTRSVALTPAGHRLYPLAVELLEQAARCVSVTRDVAAPMPYTLTLGTRYELGLSWLVPALSGLHAAKPERRIHLRFGDTDDLIEDALSAEIDALISSARQPRKGLSLAALHEERYALVGAPALLCARPLERAADVARHCALDLHPTLPLLRYFLDVRPAAEAWRFGDYEYLGTIAAVRYRALEGAGVAVLPRYFIARDLEEGRLRVVCEEVEPLRDMFRLIWREGHPLRPQLRALAEELSALPLR